MSASAEPAVELAVGVVLYQNTHEQLRRLVASLETCRAEPGTPPFAVRFLDNSPDGGSARLLETLGVTDGVERAGRNLGFGAGHNALMRKAFEAPGCTAYVCVNPDAVLHPACLRELAAELERLPRPGLVEALQFPDEHPKVYDPATHRTAWCSGCVLLISRQLFEAEAGFDENLFLYCEDVDLSWRARAAGFDVAVAPRALAHHYVHDRPPGDRSAQEMRRAGAYLADKWGGHEFGARCRAEYRELTGQDPVIEPVTPRGDAEGIADFAHLLSFSEVRW